MKSVLQILLIVLFVGLSAAHGAAQASAEGEALLVFSLDSERDLRGVRIARSDRSERVTLGPFPAGVHLQLVALPPGSYRFEAIADEGGDWETLGAQAARPFELSADALNYPGDLLIQAVTGSERLEVWLSNRSARVWERLALSYPDQVQQRRLRYAGNSPDPFPQFWARLPKSLSFPDAPPARPDQEGRPGARDFLRARAIGDLSLSPDGRLLAIAEAEEGPLRLQLIDLDSGERVRLKQSLRADTQLSFCGARCLALSSRGSHPKLRILQLSQGATWSALPIEVPVSGQLVDPLPMHERRLLFASSEPNDKADPLRLFLLDWRHGRLDASQFSRRRQLDRGVLGELGWLSDPDGRPRALLRQDDQRYLLQRPLGEGQWLTSIASTLESNYDPLTVTASDTLYALSEQQGDTRALVRTDLRDGQSRMIAAQPGSDLVGVVFDPLSRQPLAVRYFQDNRLRTRALSDDLVARLEALQSRYPDESFALTQVSDDRRRWLYFTSGDRDGGRWWVQDGAESEPIPVAADRPWLEARQRNHSRSLTLQTAEGWPLQAVVVEPAEAVGPLPVVVMPHGGPVAVRDSRLFDPQAQYLASQGFAVLQVNFRGSSGFGKHFRLAAYGAAGTKIEDDILAALDTLLADPRYDRRRVCAMGSSYGGYSALMLAIRDPKRIRCVVALAPITDLPLRFSSSDWNDNALQAAFQHRLYGDPNRSLDQQMAQSPLYRYAELRAAVLLGHGERDRRVDPEHSRRLALALARNHNPAFVRWYRDEEHGLQRLDNLIDWMQLASGFLHQQLALAQPEPRP